MDSAQIVITLQFMLGSLITFLYFLFVILASAIVLFVVNIVLFFIVFSLRYCICFTYSFSESLSETASYIYTTLPRRHLWDYTRYVIVICHFGI